MLRPYKTNNNRIISYKENKKNTPLILKNNIFSVALTHQRTPVKYFNMIYGYYREHKQFVHERLNSLLKRYKFTGGFLLVTCHRLELYVSTSNTDRIKESIVQILSLIFGKSFSSCLQYLDSYNTSDSIRHIINVATGIDSKIIGEVDIIQQIEDSLEVLRPGAEHIKEIGMIDEILPEPKNGAHTDYEFTIKIIKDSLSKTLSSDRIGVLCVSVLNPF